MMKNFDVTKRGAVATATEQSIHETVSVGITGCEWAHGAFFGKLKTILVQWNKSIFPEKMLPGACNI